ncbi:MAG: proton-conducting transporter membrane subunit [Thermosphaera sp.]
MGHEFLTALTPYLLATGAFIIVFMKALKLPRPLAQAVSLVFLSSSFFTALLIHFETVKNKVLIYTIGGFPPPIGISYVVDAFSSTLAVLVSAIFLAFFPLTRVFRIGVDEYFLALYLGLESGLLGIVLTGDLFNMFVMMEVMLVSAYGLIAMPRTGRAFIAVFKYIIVAGAGGLIFFAGVVLVYFATGTLNIGHLAAVFNGVETGYSGYSLNPSLAITGFFIILFWGLVIDEALVPLHFWLPGAYSSAHPVVSSLLAGASEGVAYYALMRIFYTVSNGFPEPVSNALKTLGILTILVGGLGMVYSKRLGEIVSYSVILDSGYVAVALSLGPLGVSVAYFYIAAHMIVKPLLFLLAGWAREEAGDDKLESLQGVFRSSRILQVGLLTSASAVIGIPPTILFAAKLQLYMGLLNTVVYNPVDALALVTALAGSGLALASFLKVIATTMLTPRSATVRGPGRVLKAYVLVLAGLTVILGLAYPLVQAGIVEPASSMLIDARDAYVESVLQALFKG